MHCCYHGAAGQPELMVWQNSPRKISESDGLEGGTVVACSCLAAVAAGSLRLMLEKM